jgi:hypothetical protein
MTDRSLRRGDLVEVRSPGEILASLDGQAMFAGVPFMPEMVGFCGRRFVVSARADKMCETFRFTSVRLPDTVFLEDLRCDGSGHDGCQAECRIFWKEAWLRRVEPSEPAMPIDADASAAALTELARRASRVAGDNAAEADRRYRCQATEHLRASAHLRTFDPRPYVRAYTNGNVGFWHFLRVAGRAAIREPLRRLHLKGDEPVRGTRTHNKPLERLEVKPGDLVRVKTREEIAETLTTDNTDQGIWFDAENIPYCGRTLRVRDRITRLIDEHTGKMIEPTEWITLETAKCTGDYSGGRWFCPRNFYAQWTDNWLEPIDSPGD